MIEFKRIGEIIRYKTFKVMSCILVEISLSRVSRSAEVAEQCGQKISFFKEMLLATRIQGIIKEFF